MRCSHWKPVFDAEVSVGILIHAGPANKGFQCGMLAATHALLDGRAVYLYLLEDAVLGACHVSVESIVRLGGRVSACAYAMEQRDIDCPEGITAAGLTLMSDILLCSERALIFN
ncbi:MAG: hypothetical protein P8L18_13590 [Verrucomicrobiota bacterium]|nr:hypothetical protein [Verrucomicrobiota bacterium]